MYQFKYTQITLKINKTIVITLFTLYIVSFNAINILNTRKTSLLININGRKFCRNFSNC